MLKRSADQAHTWLDIAQHDKQQTGVTLFTPPEILKVYFNSRWWISGVKPKARYNQIVRGEEDFYYQGSRQRNMTNLEVERAIVAGDLFVLVLQ